MQFKEIEAIEYQLGDEAKLRKKLNQAKEPLVIKIKDFTDTFSLDYFAKKIKSKTGYCKFDNFHYVSSHIDDLATVISEIKDNKPYRIFGLLSPRLLSELEQYIPLWKSIPSRPRLFDKGIKISFFLGGKGSATEMHFDREHCCNIHLCLSGKKELLLFTRDQNDNLYKMPFIGDSIIDFAYPLEVLCEKFPRLNKAEGYRVVIEKGDMVFMPRNCWHYTRYLEAASSATFVFYPYKWYQFYGYFTGFFFAGYKGGYSFNVVNRPLFKWFNHQYAWAEGWKKKGMKVFESLSYVLLLPVISIAMLIKIKLWRIFRHTRIK